MEAERRAGGFIRLEAKLVANGAVALRIVELAQLLIALVNSVRLEIVHVDAILAHNGIAALDLAASKREHAIPGIGVVEKSAAAADEATWEWELIRSIALSIRRIATGTAKDVHVSFGILVPWLLKDHIRVWSSRGLLRRLARGGGSRS